MKNLQAHFLKSAIHPDDYPRDRRPEVAFVGRSNVGKSSLLNSLLSRKGLAKTSSTPGKTQTLNFFEVTAGLYFVDLPGYGFAKVPLKVKEHWNRVMADYLRDRDTLRMVMLLVDSRHAPTDLDAHMLELLDHAEAPTLIVATKIDKVKRGERKRNLAEIRRVLELDDEAMIVPFSSVSGEGRSELWQFVEEVVMEPR